MATDVKVIYHYEDGTWWADSPDVERWSAAADELETSSRSSTKGSRSRSKPKIFRLSTCRPLISWTSSAVTPQVVGCGFTFERRSSAW